jgi:hypothetical protein
VEPVVSNDMLLHACVAWRFQVLELIFDKNLFVVDKLEDSVYILGLHFILPC